METQPYDDAQTILGLNSCGKMVSVEKPEAELSALDREKLDKLDVAGSGNSALYDNGKYKETYTKEQVDSMIDSSLEDAVFYNEQNNIEARADLIIGRNNELRAKNADGTQYTLVQATTIGITNYGDSGKLTNLVSSTRPVAQLSGESITGVHPLAFVEDVKEVTDELTDLQLSTTNNFATIEKTIDKLSSDTASGFEMVNDRIDTLASDTTSAFEDVDDRIDSIESDIEDLNSSATGQYLILNEAIEGLDDRITVNTDNITINANDISSLREDINSQDKFKGYYQTNAQIQGISGESGAYAWSAESGTVWIYDGNSWIDSGDLIPDQTVEAYTGRPLMDGRPNAGKSNEYSRGDHRHPTDITRAAASDLDNYLPLAGNTEDSRMSGDIWLGSDNSLFTSDTGESFIVHDSEFQKVLIASCAIGGIDIQTSRGIATYNGREIATEDDITAVSDEVSNVANSVSILGGKVSQNESDIAELQNAVELAEHFKGYFAKTVEITSLPGESGAFAWNGQTGTVWVYNIGVPSWVDSEKAIPSETPSDALPEMDGTADAGNVVEYARGNHVHPTDTSRASAYEVSELEKTVSSQESRLSTAEGNISSLETSVSGNSADITLLQSASSEQGTRLNTLETNVYDLQGRTSAAEGTITSLQSTVNTNTSDIQTLVGDVSSNSTAIGTLKSGVSSCKKNISKLDSRVSANESGISANAGDIESILIELANQEKFRGYYETTAEITALIGSEGNYAWNGETQSVWLYDGNTWADSGAAIPMGAGVSSSDLTPLVDGEANAGSSNQYSRGDHRHPTDTSRAAAADLTALSNTVDGIDEVVEELAEEFDELSSVVDEIKTNVADNDNAIGSLQSDITDVQIDLDDLKSELNIVEENVKVLSEELDENISAVSVNTSAISILQNNLSETVENIEELRININENASLISANTTAISSLKSDFSDTESDIDNLRSDVETNKSDITSIKSNRVENLGGVTGIITFATDQEAETYSSRNPNVLVISLQG